MQTYEKHKNPNWLTQESQDYGNVGLKLLFHLRSIFITFEGFITFVVNYYICGFNILPSWVLTPSVRNCIYLFSIHHNTVNTVLTLKRQLG